MYGLSLLQTLFFIVLLAAVPLAYGQDGPGDARGMLIRNVRIADGTGAPLTRADVRVRGDRIVRVGTLESDGQERVIDAGGRVLAPGFIDIHNHSDGRLGDHPLAESQISQGITTIVVGADGSSPWPIDAWLRERREKPAALNVALLVGHATTRAQVLGEDYERHARPAEVERMAALVERSMREGAIGLSSGLEYEVASYSTTDEVVALARAAARHGGFYMTHIRDEADRSIDALREAIAIGRQARIAVQHSHIKLGTVGVWGRAPEFIRLIDQAREDGVDYLADYYPYNAWYSSIKVLVPNKQYEDPASVARGLDDVGGAQRVTIAGFPANPAYEKHTLAELARTAGITPVDMYIRIIREGDAAETTANVIAQSMIREDMKAFVQQPWVMIASDGGIGGPHPRGAGTFPRVLASYVREEQWLDLPEAVRKMTALPAKRLGWEERGVIREGAYADLVLFDPDTVIDRATFEQPETLSTGIDLVVVNGTIVWSGAKPTGARPGRVLSR